MSAALREALCAASQTLERLGLNCGTAGNVSVRVEGGFIITPALISTYRRVLIKTNASTAPNKTMALENRYCSGRSE